MFKTINKKNLWRRFRKTGLVLGSGAARGLAHIGVLKAIKEKNVSVDMIIGSSMGALVGACYARKGEISEIEDLVLKTDWVQLLKLADWNLALMFKGFIHGQNVRDLLETVIGDIQFKDLQIPLVVVATDLHTGKKVIITEGSVLDAVRASISIPVIFMPMKIEDKFLVDGGIVDPVPVKVARKMGAKFVIASNVLQPPHMRKVFPGTKKVSVQQENNTVSEQLSNKLTSLILENEEKLGNFKEIANNLTKKITKTEQKDEADTLECPNIFDAVFQVIYVMEYELARRSSDKADIVITPDTSNIASLEFDNAEKAINEGYKAAIKLI